MLVRAKPVAWLFGVLTLAAFAVGGWYLYEWNERLIRVGDVRIDPLKAIDKTQRYEVVVWEYDLYLPGIDPQLRRAAIEAAAAELKEVHPNISVRIEFLRPDPDLRSLIQALEAGVGPDIAGLTGGTVLVDHEHQIPVTPYMSAQTQEDILPSVRKALHVGNHLWTWPRWVDTTVWVGQTKYLDPLAAQPALAAKELFGNGETWRAQIGGHHPVAYNGYDAQLFNAIAVASTGRTLLSSTGEVAWTKEEIQGVADLLTSMVASGLAAKDVESASRSRLRSFWDGQTVFLSPVNRVLLHHILSRLGDLTYDSDRTSAPDGVPKTTLLSPPFLGDHLAAHYGTVSSYAVFRRSEHAGDDHTRAVMTVAQHLSHRMGHWEAANLLTIPAYTSGLAGWQRDSGLTEQHANSLVTLVQRLVTPPGELRLALLEGAALEQVIGQALPQLLAGGTTAEQFADDVAKGLHGFLAAHAVPASAL